jgi:hypothetical protein
MHILNSFSNFTGLIYARKRKLRWIVLGPYHSPSLTLLLIHAMRFAFVIELDTDQKHGTLSKFLTQTYP